MVQHEGLESGVGGCKLGADRCTGRTERSELAPSCEAAGVSSLSDDVGVVMTYRRRNRSAMT